MAGFKRLSRFFQRRRKRNGSSRRCAIMSKQPDGFPATLTAPAPNNNTMVETKEETSVQDTKLSRSVGALFFAVGGIMQKCSKTIYRTCSGFLNVCLFWRRYADRVESLHQKVEELQREIALLHSALKLSREAKTAGGNGEILNGVNLSTPLLPVSLPPPPPPLPPPPPPPPPLPSKLAVPKLVVVPIKSAQPTFLKKQRDGPVAVTLHDLQAVRLRKVTVSHKTQMSPDRKRSPLVTLADLQKVRLRRSHSELPLKFRSSLGRTPTKSPVNLRVPLRKVMNRSPGGTPLFNKENEKMDSSLDPRMKNALGNSHLNALTKGLSQLKAA
ncbi:proline-rich protein 11 isoform X2 [Myxocyprinus asiaticus]|uniref:proline-rich protein 11 isoform X2 n=1 Tax=Myxocyprinus asiaticus TaxID=70543 RepID=UPI0022226AB5|nr:proline-rich protein 11 isoform X2 [Myxocyprinus asiaticus]